MKKFMCDDFLLEGEVAKKLYHDYAKNMPIYDYHCHLNPKEIAENKKYKNITEIWLGGDHYKWRAMRSNGVPEEFITGNSSDKEKFMKWAECVPQTIGNPLYHWTHLELKRYFGIEETLSSKTAEMIWEKCNELLAKDEFSARELIKRSNVKALCTTDDPADTLEFHDIIAKDKGFDVKVLPTFRPDKSVNINKIGFSEYIEKLGSVVDRKITTYFELLEVLKERLDFFHGVGCRVADHGLDSVFYREYSEEEIVRIFEKGLNNQGITQTELEKYFTSLMTFFGKEYTKRGWVMQLHIGAIRNNSDKMFAKLGPDTGFDSIGDYSYALELSKLMNRLDSTDELPKTILYTLNPKDNYVLGTMIGNFQGGGVPGKIQFGSGWWFNDQRDGMVEQMKALSNLGLLSRFVGMLTDSRSFLSYTRHEYFRRILCNLIGNWVENGEFPEEYDLLGEIIQNISYNNINSYIIN